MRKDRSPELEVAGWSDYMLVDGIEGCRVGSGMQVGLVVVEEERLEKCRDHSRQMQTVVGDGAMVPGRQ